MVVEAVVKYKKQCEEVDKDNGFLVRNSRCVRRRQYGTVCPPSILGEYLPYSDILELMGRNEQKALAFVARRRSEARGLLGKLNHVCPRRIVGVAWLPGHAYVYPRVWVSLAPY